MVDAAVVMIENAQQACRGVNHANPGRRATTLEQKSLIADAAAEVGPALSSACDSSVELCPSHPRAQEGKLFGPLAFTKTYSMAAAAGLSVTLIRSDVLLYPRAGFRDERKQSLSMDRVLIAI